MDRVDMLLENARFCVNCEVVTSAPDRCLRCSGPVVPLSTWIKPINIPEPSPAYTTYGLRTVGEDSEDMAVFFTGDGGCSQTFLTSEAALESLQHNVAGLKPSTHPLISRLTGVVSVWDQTFDIPGSPNPLAWCVVEIKPKSA